MDTPNEARKRELRTLMRARRDTMPASEHARASRAACERLAALPEMRAARTVALYCAMGSELAPNHLVEVLASLRPAPALAAPAVLTTAGDTAGPRMEFVHVEARELLGTTVSASTMDASATVARPDFLTHPARPTQLPAGREAISPSQIDLMVIPGLAFDVQGFRLGYGGGYYDAYLRRAGASGGKPHALRCGICFDEQLLDVSLPVEPHDMRMDMVITPAQTLVFSNPLGPASPRP